MATAQWGAPWLFAGAALLLVLGWIRPWAWTGRASLGIVAVVGVGLLFRTATMRIALMTAALAADRRLDSGSVFATALEVRGDTAPGLFGARVLARAEEFASTADVRTAIPVRAQPRRMAVGAVAGVAALGLAFGPNPQDEVRAGHRRLRTQLQSVATPIRRAANLALLQARSPLQQRVAQRLLSTAETLERAASLKVARAELQRSATALRLLNGPEGLAAKAATVGLERSLATRPLIDEGADMGAVDQLMAVGASAGSRSTAQQAKVAQRLAALANAQRTGNPVAAGALDRAAKALRNGDAKGAQRALDAAAAAQRSAATAAAGADAAAAGAAALESADSSLSVAQSRAGQSGSGRSGSGRSGSGQSGGGQSAAGQSGTGRKGQGQAPGQGQGQAQGSGRKGPGQGHGQGQGSDPGRGVASGGVGGTGSPSGVVGGANDGLGAKGRGVRGQVGTGGPNVKPEPGVEGLSGTLVFAVTPGHNVTLTGPRHAGPTKTVGKVAGATKTGVAKVALATALPEYQAAASRAATVLDVPASQRAVVRAYFEALARTPPPAGPANADSRAAHGQGRAADPAATGTP